MNYLSASETSSVASSMHKILCCRCGTPIEPNPSNTCVNCLRAEVDITQEIPKQAVLNFCKFCERYLQPPSNWVGAQLESRELMAICLGRLKNLNRVRTVDAAFVWTEPHSKRVRVKLTVQAEVHTGTVLQQTFVVEYIVQNQMCEDCHRVEAKDTWNASVQVRQRGGQNKTLYYLEQLLMKYDMTRECNAIKPVQGGLDFFYSTEAGARRMSEFLQSTIPMRSQHAKKLISQDGKSNEYNYKYTTSVEVVPICKDNIVCLPSKVAHSLGGIGQICVVNKVTTLLHLIDPNTCQFAEISAPSYFKTPFLSLIKPKMLTEYTIMNVEPIGDHERRRFKGQGAFSKKHGLADVWVIKSSELGLTEDTIHCRTHLGHLLNPGDLAMGFDLKNCNVNDPNLEKLSPDKTPDVVLVKKVYADKSLRNRKRKWRLRHMEGLHDLETASQNEDYREFLEDLEEDADLRKNVNVYKDPRKLASGVQDDDLEEDVPKIDLAEMLDEMNINTEQKTEEEGEAAAGSMNE